MKPLFTLLLLASGLLAKSTPIDTKAINPAVKTFEATYGKNNNASWTCSPGGCQVTFELKGQTITAVYTLGGQLRWYKKHILSTQLPVTLQLKLKNRFAGYWIADVEEVSATTGARYVLTLENGFKKIKLQATAGTWQHVQTISKA